MNKYCQNHPFREAVNKCHNCGYYFCAECLSEGHEYYYCDKPECREQYIKEILPEIVNCPECLDSIELDKRERAYREFTCPGCGNFIEWDTYPSQEKKYNFIKIAETFNLGDIALIKSILDESDIEFYFSGENFLYVRQLVQPAQLFVREDQINTVKKILKDFEFHLFGPSSTTNKIDKDTNSKEN